MFFYINFDAFVYLKNLNWQNVIKSRPGFFVFSKKRKATLDISAVKKLMYLVSTVKEPCMLFKKFFFSR